MIVWGLDMASATGSCYGRPDSTPYATTVRAPVGGDSLGYFGAFYFRFFTNTLHALIKRLEPGEGIVVAYELPLLPPKRWDKAQNKMVGGTNLSTTRRLHFLGTALEGVCIMISEETGVKITLIPAHVSQLKKELGGGGAASKLDMVYAARKCGISLPEGEEAKDSADAFSAFLYGVKIAAPEHFNYWLKRLHSGSHRI